MGATACVRPEKIGCRMRAAVIVVLLSAVIFEASLAAVPEFEADEFEAFNGNTELLQGDRDHYADHGWRGGGVTGGGIHGGVGLRSVRKTKHSKKHSKFEKSQK